MLFQACQNWLIESIRQQTTKMQKDIACSFVVKRLTIPECCYCFHPYTFNAEDLTSEKFVCFFFLITVSHNIIKDKKYTVKCDNFAPQGTTFLSKQNINSDFINYFSSAYFYINIKNNLRAAKQCRKNFAVQAKFEAFILTLIFQIMFLRMIKKKYFHIFNKSHFSFDSRENIDKNLKNV